MHSSLAYLAFLAPLTACTATEDVEVTLTPDLISSIDGTLDVQVIALAGHRTISGDKVDVTVDYTDRNGTAHMINPLAGTIDHNGAFEGRFEGLQWDGTGTVTATVHGGDGDVSNIATFAVLDRTPPAVEITPPAQIRVNTDTNVTVHVTDEIGVSQVYFESSFSNGGGGNNGSRGRIVASGSLDATVQFTVRANDTQAGATVTLYALAEDLSGNQAAAKPIVLTVAP